MDFDLKIPVRVISGRGCVKNNAALLAELGKTCLIVTGGKSAKLSGAVADVTAALEEQGVSFSVFDGVTANPLLSACREAGTLASKTGAEFIIGIGGGSPLDAAKAAAVFAANPALSAEEIYTVKQRNKALPIVAIGTTAGTGSEVGRVAVLTNDKTGRKKSISPDDCNPTLTFADPKYTESMPFAVTCSTALDALSHAVEGYFSSKCGDIPTLFAEKGIPLILGGLKVLDKTKTNPSPDQRDALYYGSLYAGITLAYCGTAFPHPLGYVLTENYGVPHGFACAAFLPEFLRRAAAFRPERMERLLKLTGETLDSLCSLIVSLTTLPEITMTEDQLKDFSSRWDVLPANFRFTPGGFTKEDAEETLHKFVLPR